MLLWRKPTGDPANVVLAVVLLLLPADEYLVANLTRSLCAWTGLLLSADLVGQIESLFILITLNGHPRERHTGGLILESEDDLLDDKFHSSCPPFQCCSAKKWQSISQLRMG